MDWLNYHHLFYFWTAVREGSISAASRKLRLAQPTLSGQIKELEKALDVALFQRKGGRLVLTEPGSHVYRYAAEIFELGRELREFLAGRSELRGSKLVVGLADVIPKLVARRLLEPALALEQSLRLACYEDRHETLLAELALHKLDAVLTDTPSGPHASVRAFNHLLGECGVSLFAKPAVAAKLRPGFPRSLDGAPVLLPIEHTSLRRGLSRWFEREGVRPRVRGEFQDAALLLVMGQAGEGVFAAPSVIEAEVERQHEVAVLARLEDVRESFYVITVERRVSHPAVRALMEAAREDFFGGA